MYKEQFWIEDTKVAVEYSIEPPEPDVGITGGVAIESLEVIGVRYSALGSKVSIADLEDAAAEEIRRDLGL